MSDHPDPVPRQWDQMSFDQRMFLVAFVGNALMFGMLEPAIVVGVVNLALGAILVFLSIRNRRACGWRWAGADILGLARSLFVITGLAVLAFVSGIGDPPAGWYALILLFGVMQVLVALRFVRKSKAAFAADCAGPPMRAPAPRPTPPASKAIVDGPGASWTPWAIGILAAAGLAAAFVVFGR